MATRKNPKTAPAKEHESAGELLVAWQKYTAITPDELSLKEGDVVELIDTEDPTISSPKRMKLDPEFEIEGDKLLDSSAAKHKLSVKPKRTRHSSRYSPSRTPLNARWLVRQVKGEKKQGWVPCQILQTLDDPQPGTGLPGDAAFRRQAVVKELVETEQEFVRDLDFVVQKYLIGSEKEPRKPKIVKDNFELIFGNLKEISEFHRTVLMEGVKYYANEPHLLGKAFLRLERDFDKHVNYCKEEPLAQTFLDTCKVAKEYFDDLSHRLDDDKTISEHLKLPIQRINDYQLLLKELVRYSACLGEDNTDLQKALELMLSVPHRAQDDKFTNSIEGYRGSIHKLGRLLAHDWFSVCFGDITKERYLFLFKGRILISKVRRISDDRSVFQLKDIIKLPQVEIKDHSDNPYEFELIDKTAGHALVLTSHRDDVKEFWIQEIKEFATEAESGDDLQVISQPTSPPEPRHPEYQLNPPPKIEIASAKEESLVVKSSKTVKQESFSSTESSGFKEETKSVQVTSTVAKKSESASVETSKVVKVQETKTGSAKVTESVSEKQAESVKAVETSKVESVKTAEVSKVESVKAAEAVKVDTKKADAPKAEVAKVDNPKVEPSKVDNPKVEPSKVENPKVEPSKVEPPKVENPKVEPSKVETTKVQNPKVEAQKVEAVKVEAPKVDKPKTETPKAEVSKAENPKVENPKVETPQQTKVEAPKAVEKEKPQKTAENPSKQEVDSSKPVGDVKLVRKVDDTKQVEISISRSKSELFALEHTASSSVLARDDSTSDLVHSYGDSFRVNVEVDLAIDKEGKQKPTDYGTKENGSNGEMSSSSYNRRSASNGRSNDSKYSVSMESSGKYRSYSDDRNGGDDYSSKYLSKSSVERKSMSASMDKDFSSEDYSKKYSKYSSVLEDTDYSKKYSTSALDDTDYSKKYASKYSTDSDYSKKYSTTDIDYSKKYSTSDTDYSKKYSTSALEDTDYSKMFSSKYASDDYSKKYSTTGLEDTDYTTKYSSSGTDRTDYSKKYSSSALDDSNYSKKYSSNVLDDNDYSKKYSSSVLDDSDYNKKYSSSKYATSSLDDNKYSKSDDDYTQNKKYRKYSSGYSASTLDESEEYGKYKRFSSFDESSHSKRRSEGEDHGSRRGSKDRKKLKDQDRADYSFSRRSIKESRSGDKSGEDAEYTSWKRAELLKMSIDEEDGNIYTSSMKSYKRVSSIDSDDTSYKITDESRKYKSRYSIEEDDGVTKLSNTEEIRKYKKRYSIESDEDSSRSRKKSVEERRKYKIDEESRVGYRRQSSQNEVEICEIIDEDLDPNAYVSKIKAKSEFSRITVDGENNSTGKYSRTTSLEPVVVVEEEDRLAKFEKYSKRNANNARNDEIDVIKKDELVKESEITKENIKLENKMEEQQKEQIDEKEVSNIENEEEMKEEFEIRKDQEKEMQKKKEDEKVKKMKKEKEHDEEKEKEKEMEKEREKEKEKEKEKGKEKEREKEREKQKEKEKVKEKEKEKESENEKEQKKPKDNKKSNESEKQSKKDKTKQNETDSFQTVTKKTVFDQQVLEHVVEKSKSKTDIGMAPPDEVPKFTKTMGGAHVKPYESAFFEIRLDDTPDSLTFLKDNRIIDGELAKRIRVRSSNEHRNWTLEFFDAEESDSGIITAVACNAKGKSTCTAHLLVHTLTEAEQLELKKPDFIIKLKDTELLEDTHLRFMMKIKGDPHPTLSFFKDGTQIKESERIRVNRDHSDHDFYELVIDNVKKSDAGTYKCVLKNEHGEASSEAKVIITDSTTLFSEFADNDALLPKGEKPSFIWKKDGEEFEVEERFKVLMGDDEDSLALIFQHVKPEDAGLYTCVAQTSTGHISCSAELTVHGTVHELHREPEKPQLVIEKREAITSVGATCIMELQVKGFPKPKVNFIKEGKPIEASAKYKFMYEDEETMSLIIKNVEASDAGKYEIRAENELGQDIREMEVIVKQPPKIAKMSDTTGATEQELKMTADVDGIPKPTVQFYKDGKVLKNSDLISIVEEGKKHSLVIKKTTLKDTGSYSVVASNEVAQVSQFWNLDIYCKPKILKKLGENKEVMQQTDVELSIKFESEPVPEVTWYKDDKEIKSDGHFTISNDGDTYKLKISGTVTTDSASYKVKAKNIHGTIEDEARVDVKRAPTVTKGLQDMTVTEHDSNVTLDLKIDAFPKPKVQWYLGEVEISEKKNEFTRIETQDSVQLVIKEVTTEMKGKWTCKLINELGETSSSASLTIKCKPRIIKHLKETTVEEGATLQLEVEVEAVPEPTVKWLRNGKEISADARIIITRDSQRNETYSLTANLIKYEEQGEYEVQITNALGTVSSKSQVTVMKILHTDAIEEEIHIIKQDTKDTSETVEITEPPQGQQPQLGESEAWPSILDTNVKDCSNYESLNQVYTVKVRGNPLPSAAWTVDGKEIKQGGNLRYKLSSEGDLHKLEIQKLEPKDGGVFEVTVSNSVGEVKQQGKLDIIPEAELRRPKVREGLGLKDQDILKKKSATMKTVITADPIPDARWLFNGEEITPEKFEEYKMVLESDDTDIENHLKEITYSLTIPRCERVNGGKYTLRLKNKWGEKDDSGVLNVVLAPEIGPGPDIVKVVPGDATELTCIIQSNPKAIVTWTKSENVIESSEDIEIIEDIQNERYTLKFNTTKMSDEGYYQVYAKNEYGQDNSEGRIKIIKTPDPSTEKPKFITGLSDAHVVHGGEISMMVRADGLPKPELRWYLNNRLITNAPELQFTDASDRQITSTLTITNYDEKDEGEYKVTAVNVVGDAETVARVDMHLTPPTFTKRIERTEDLKEGESLVLKAKMTGSPKPTAAWYKDGELVEPDNKLIKTETSPDGAIKLTVDNVSTLDSGAYKLVITNKVGETAGLCAVAVMAAPRRPKFSKCIKDTKAMIGEPMRLVAQVTGFPPPEVKWMKDGVLVRASPNVHLEHHPDGTIALVVDNVGPEHAGVYTLIVSNKMGDVTGEAKVEIEKRPLRPQFVTKLSPQTVVEGFPVKFEVKATGFPAPTITWSRNGAEVISDSKHIRVVDHENGVSSLLIEACDQIRDAITYVAKAVNEAGEAETSAPLKVTPASLNDQPEERPMFLHPLRDVITDEGQPLTIEAPFSGNPIPSVAWSKDGLPIEASERILLTCDGKKVGLTIDRAVPSDAGQYGVVITNPLGSESSQAKASVHKVFQAPSFLQKFGDLQQMPTRDAKFPARVSGVPAPEVAWFKDGQPLKETDKYHIKRDGDACCLYVQNCQPEDEGVYSCTITNKEGKESCTGRLEVVKEIRIAKKIEPANFVKKIGDTELYKGMTAKFTACAAGIPEPTVEWYRNDQRLYPSDRIRMEVDRNGLLRLTIAGVDQDDLGKYTCKIHNEHGSDTCDAHMRFDEGLESKPKKPMTDQYTEYDKYKKSGAPMPLADAPIISRMTDRHCTISWKPSIPSAPRAPVTYQLEMLEMPNGDWFTVRSGIRSCCCDVRNLEPFRDYKFRVRVENKYGISDPSPYAVTHREKLEPDAPKFMPYLPPGIDFRPETSPYFPKDFDVERPPHDNMAQAPIFLRQEDDAQYGVKDHNCNLFWFVYGYPKPKITYYFNDDLIEPGGRFDMSYTRNGQATLFINKMLERDVGFYEAVASNEHGEARQRVRLLIAEPPTFNKRPDIEYVMVRGKARFEARIVGVPYPEIKWYKDWKPLANSSRTKIQFMDPDTAILVINDAIFKDEGLYSVSARNVAGSISASAMLHVEENDLEYNIRTYNNPAAIKLKKKPYTDAYDIGDELGRGTQGITYHAVERLNGRNYAAKIMKGHGDFKPMMYNEWEIMNQLHHRRLISLHDAYEHEDYLTLITELAAGGELVKDYLLKQEYYSESEIAGYIRQLLQGLQYMHERGFGHMGLNIGDLLLSHPGSDELKITDFGLSRQIQMGRLYPLKYGVPEFVSPECANGEGTGLGHDMWSVGIITYILLSGQSPFRGEHDKETLTRIQQGKWTFEESWWSNLSIEARDFITKLLVYQADGRMDVHTALRHPWLERADKIYTDEYRISSKYLRDYFMLYREWYNNASCRDWFRRRPLEGAFTHPSKMVYPPGERYTPPPAPVAEKVPRKPKTWEDQIPSRSPLNYEIGAFKSESHYQNGPDTYLLQLRDVDFPVRLREYMKVAGSRGAGYAHIMSNENGFDWETPVIRERRRFTDIMDEEIDDERKNRINHYGSGDVGFTVRRLRHEIGTRLDTYAEAEAFLESKMVGRLPFFREKPQMVAMREGFDLEMVCLAVGDPEPVVQWFKNDAIIAESHRIKIETDKDGRSHFKLCPALSFDVGTYKVVARNKIGQTIARTRIVFGTVPDAPDSPEGTQISDVEILLTWKQPRHDGHSPVICYSIQYKLADDMEWTDKANNIDHEFYLMKDLRPGTNYLFRLAAKNAIGWSDFGVASPVLMTQPTGAPKIQLSRAMNHLQQITDSGAEVIPETSPNLNYTIENKPIEWTSKDPHEKYNFISEISRGRFSTVVKAIDKRNDHVVVAKSIDTKEQGEQNVEGEFAALRSLRHERVATLLEAYKVPDGSTVFIMEKLQGADVLTYLSTRHEYSEQTVATIVSQILDGLQYLHWRGLCHLDLQPDNVVMCSVRSIQIKLVDFGCAHRVTKLGSKVPAVGHSDYVSPEVICEEPAYPQTDIWSVGVLTYVMLSGTLPFKGDDDDETRQNIMYVRFRFEHLYNEVSQEGVRFVMMLFKRHPNKRPTAEECHENRWLLPTDFMIKKRERAVFLGNRLKEYCEHYHSEKVNQQTSLGGKMNRSHSIQEELLTAPF